MDTLNSRSITIQKKASQAKKYYAESNQYFLSLEDLIRASKQEEYGGAFGGDFTSLQPKYKKGTAEWTKQRDEVLSRASEWNRALVFFGINPQGFVIARHGQQTPVTLEQGVNYLLVGDSSLGALGGVESSFIIPLMRDCLDRMELKVSQLHSEAYSLSGRLASFLGFGGRVVASTRNSQSKPESPVLETVANWIANALVVFAGAMLPVWFG